VTGRRDEAIECVPAAPARRGVRAVERALDLLTAFSDAHPVLQLHELAAATLLPKPSVHRIATTLIDYGFLRQGPDGAYSLGTRVIELGNLAASSSSLLKIATPVAAEMARATGETILIAELDWVNMTIRIVHRIDSEHALSVLSPVGRQSPIGNGCVAKAGLFGLPAEVAARITPQLTLTSRTPQSLVDIQALMAEVDEARQRGYATERDEFSVGVVGVAAPIAVGGRPIGAVLVVAPASRCKNSRLHEMGKRLSKLISIRLGDGHGEYVDMPIFSKI